MMRAVKHKGRRPRPAVSPWLWQDSSRSERREWTRLEREHADLRDMFADDGEFMDAVEGRWALV